MTVWELIDAHPENGDIRYLDGGRRVLGNILSDKLRWVPGSIGRFCWAGSKPSRDDFWLRPSLFVDPTHSAIFAAVLAGLEVGVLLTNGAIVEVCGNLGDDTEAIREELNAIAPFRWHRGNGWLGRELVA